MLEMLLRKRGAMNRRVLAAASWTTLARRVRLALPGEHRGERRERRGYLLGIYRRGDPQRPSLERLLRAGVLTMDLRHERRWGRDTGAGLHQRPFRRARGEDRRHKTDRRTPYAVGLRQTTPMTAGQTVTVTFWARASANRTIQVGIQQQISPRTWYSQQEIAVTKSWARYAFTFTAKATDATATLKFLVGDVAGTVWFDNIGVLSSGSTCAPTSCAAKGAHCGSLPDGCGGTLSCGSCAAPETCGGGGTPNVCGVACTKTTCAAKGASCGTIPDGCGGTLSVWQLHGARNVRRRGHAQRLRRRNERRLDAATAWLQQESAGLRRPVFGDDARLEQVGHVSGIERRRLGRWRAAVTAVERAGTRSLQHGHVQPEPGDRERRLDLDGSAQHQLLRLHLAVDQRHRDHRGQVLAPRRWLVRASEGADARPNPGHVGWDLVHARHRDEPGSRNWMATRAG